MARYQHLPIFQAIYNLSLEIHQRVNDFPRTHKHSIGEKLKKIAYDLMELIIEANSAKEKTEFLRRSEVVLEKLKIYIRLCYDLKILGIKGFEYLCRTTDDIGRQINKWKEWSVKQAKITT
ncbi:MAG: four helix bundle protein [bacterium]|nr:four helix bundle protein [bacterium]